MARSGSLAGVKRRRNVRLAASGGAIGTGDAACLPLFQRYMYGKYDRRAMWTAHWLPPKIVTESY